MVNLAVKLHPPPYALYGNTTSHSWAHMRMKCGRSAYFFWHFLRRGYRLCLASSRTQGDQPPSILIHWLIHRNLLHAHLHAPMCRLTAYIGHPTLVADLVTRPSRQVCFSSMLVKKMTVFSQLPVLRHSNPLPRSYSRTRLALPAMKNTIQAFFFIAHYRNDFEKRIQKAPPSLERYYRQVCIHKQRPGSMKRVAWKEADTHMDMRMLTCSHATAQHALIIITNVCIAGASSDSHSTLASGWAVQADRLSWYRATHPSHIFTQNMKRSTFRTLTNKPIAFHSAPSISAYDMCLEGKISWRMEVTYSSGLAPRLFVCCGALWLCFCDYMASIGCMMRHIYTHTFIPIYGHV